jgi:hypothetical protein
MTPSFAYAPFDPSSLTSLQVHLGSISTSSHHRARHRSPLTARQAPTPIYPTPRAPGPDSPSLPLYFRRPTDGLTHPHLPPPHLDLPPPSSKAMSVSELTITYKSYDTPALEYKRMCQDLIDSVPNRVLPPGVRVGEQGVTNPVHCQDDAYAWLVQFQERWVRLASLSLPLSLSLLPFSSLLLRSTPSFRGSCPTSRAASIAIPSTMG